MNAEKDSAVIRKDACAKSVKIVLVNVSKLVGIDGNPIDLTNTNRLRRWIIEKYNRREVAILDDGRTIRFGNEELRASVKRRGKEQREIYADLDTLFENCIYYGYELSDERHPRIDRQNIYYIKKEPLPPYQGFSPSGIGSGQTMPVLKIQEAMDVNCKISDYTSKVNSKTQKN